MLVFVTQMLFPGHTQVRRMVSDLVREGDAGGVSEVSWRCKSPVA